MAQVDPPERIARLNFIDGAVSYLPSGGDENDWVTAVMNRALTAGDQLWADANSRGELHIGSTTVRMNSNTGISFLNLDDTGVQIRLSDGSMILRLRHLDPGETYEVDTPNLAFAVKRAGNYRIESNPDNNASINVTNTIVNRATVVNVFNNRNVQPITYVNRAVPSGVTVVPHEAFVNARPVAHNVINVPTRELNSAPVTRAIQVAPEPTSVYGAGNCNTPHPTAKAINRPVVVRQTPPPAPNHFKQQQVTRPDRPPNEAMPRQATPPPQAQPPQRPARQVTPPPQVEPPQSPPRQVQPDQQKGTRTAPMPPNQGAEKSRHGSRPLLRPAPPVRPPTPQEQADTQTKQKAWKDAHQRNTKGQKQQDQKSDPTKK